MTKLILLSEDQISKINLLVKSQINMYCNSGVPTNSDIQIERLETIMDALEKDVREEIYRKIEEIVFEDLGYTQDNDCERCLREKLKMVQKILREYGEKE